MSVNAGAVVASAAAEVHRRFRGYVERDDLIQEGNVWVLMHPARMREYDEDENYKRSEYRLRRDVSSVMDLYARRQKAATLGYDVADEYAYGVAQVEGLLPYVLRGELERPVEASEGPSARTDPAEGGNFTTMVLDVSAAWEKAALDPEERAMVMRYILDAETPLDISEDMGISRQAATTKIRRAIRRVVNELGGIKSKGCPYDCECHEGRLRTRPGVHSEISGANQLAS